jgi:4'-phosphopantetheinyl transferase
MAFFIQKEVGRKGKLGIWHINEQLENLLQFKRVSAKNMATLSSFKYENRKKEWLVARILASKLTEDINVQIIYDDYNKPFLQNSQMHISLSHSHNFLTLILDELETGIDIERIKPQIINIKGKFMSTLELNSLQIESIAEQLTVYWCAKESLYKLYGKRELIFKENLLIEPFQYAGNGIIRGWIKTSAMNKCFSLKYENLKLESEHYMLTYVINGD